MKRFFAFAVILASLSVTAFAAKNSQNVTVSSPVMVGKTELPAGDYKVSWTGSGANVQVTFAERGKTPVTVPAKIVEAKNGHVALLTSTENGANVLQAVQLDNLSIMLTGSSASGE